MKTSSVQLFCSFECEIQCIMVNPKCMGYEKSSRYGERGGRGTKKINGLTINGFLCLLIVFLKS